MAVTLEKGQRVSLTKMAPALNQFFVGLGWDTKPFDTGFDFDLDASVFLLGANEKLISDNHFIFYNNLISPDAARSVEHQGDNLTGSGEGDDEVIKVNLKTLPEDIKKIVIVATIHEADKRSQSFGQVDNAYIRVVDPVTGEEVFRYDLTEELSIETAMILGEFYLLDNEWKFNAVGAGYEGGLQAFLDRFQNS